MRRSPLASAGSPERVVDLRHPHPRVEDVALELAERLRRVDLAAVGVHHGVARVLPPEVLVALVAPRPVLLEPVAVEIAVAVDPLEAALGDGPVAVEERVVAEPPPRLVERDEVERRRVRGAVVGRVRDLVEVRELAEPELVQDLARLGVAKGVELRRLVARRASRARRARTRGRRACSASSRSGCRGRRARRTTAPPRRAPRRRARSPGRGGGARRGPRPTAGRAGRPPRSPR